MGGWTLGFRQGIVIVLLSWLWRLWIIRLEYWNQLLKWSSIWEWLENRAFNRTYSWLRIISSKLPILIIHLPIQWVAAFRLFPELNIFLFAGVFLNDRFWKISAVSGHFLLCWKDIIYRQLLRAPSIRLERYLIFLEQGGLYPRLPDGRGLDTTFVFEASDRW